ncbi:sensor histidine kinase [Bacillus pinisoli]|uniref:sensor histidine kinase n=1 Tax=Bacillus pinisoli TaxID=2901866 RepID=UPI001FF67CE1|nr:HAMP domain-containing sensor histidine kinase [Bacillus pinisoli]
MIIKHSNINLKLYYSTVVVGIIIMFIGLFVGNSRSHQFNLGIIVHGVLVVCFTLCLILYPIYKSQLLRIVMMIVATTYFYTIFLLYPYTWSNFIFLCLIPAMSILFFDKRLFYFSLFLNALLVFSIFSYIILVDQEEVFPYIAKDMVGNVINFIGSQVILFYIFYLTYRRLKKQELYYEQIKHSERLKTTGQLAAAVAHEIRNPLTVVKGFLQLYERDPSYNEDNKRHFSLMINELDTAEKVISQFLSIAKPEKETETELVNVKLVLQSVTDLLNSYGHLHDHNIILNMGEECYIDASTIELKQLLINIIKNAMEASKLGDSVEITAESKNGFIYIHVIDTGEGMTKEEIDSLGTPFYSLKSRGTGLGMMICFNIVAKYKGAIDIDSEKGKGTTVTIRFPAAKEGNC